MIIIKDYKQSLHETKKLHIIPGALKTDSFHRPSDYLSKNIWRMRPNMMINR